MNGILGKITVALMIFPIKNLPHIYEYSTTKTHSILDFNDIPSYFSIPSGPSQLSGPNVHGLRIDDGVQQQILLLGIQFNLRTFMRGVLELLGMPRCKETGGRRRIRMVIFDMYIYICMYVCIYIYVIIYM
jgi:hypothetical protein